MPSIRIVSWQRAVVPAAGVALLVSCGALFTTKIADIKRSPAQYDGKSVVVAGSVTGSANLLLIKFFKVKDSTDEITVVTDAALPKEGDTVRVKGKVNQAFALGSNRLVVIVEEPRQR
jgi:hypothetical protein